MSLAMLLLAWLPPTVKQICCMTFFLTTQDPYTWHKLHRAGLTDCTPHTQDHPRLQGHLLWVPFGLCHRLCHDLGLHRLDLAVLLGICPPRLLMAWWVPHSQHWAVEVVPLRWPFGHRPHARRQPALQSITAPSILTEPRCSSLLRTAQVATMSPSASSVPQSRFVCYSAGHKRDPSTTNLSTGPPLMTPCLLSCTSRRPASSRL